MNPAILNCVAGISNSNISHFETEESNSTEIITSQKKKIATENIEKTIDEVVKWTKEFCEGKERETDEIDEGRDKCMQFILITQVKTDYFCLYANRRVYS